MTHLSSHEEHRRGVLTSGHAGAAAYAGCGVHRHVSLMFIDRYGIGINARNYLEASRYLGDSIQGNVRAVCRKPEITYMFSNYLSTNGFPQYAEPDDIYNMLRRDSINYLIVDNWFRHAYVTLYPCIQKYPEKFKVIKKFGDVDTIRKINPTYIFYFNDEWGYTGDMKDGVREGKGVLKMQDGRKYEGEFQRNLPNGIGTIYDSTGRKLVTGYWQNGALTRVVGM